MTGHTQITQWGQVSVGGSDWGRYFKEEVRFEGASLLSFICPDRSELRRSLSRPGSQGCRAHRSPVFQVEFWQTADKQARR